MNIVRYAVVMIIKHVAVYVEKMGYVIIISMAETVQVVPITNKYVFVAVVRCRKGKVTA